MLKLPPGKMRRSSGFLSGVCGGGLGEFSAEFDTVPGTPHRLFVGSANWQGVMKLRDIVQIPDHVAHLLPVVYFALLLHID